MSYFSRRRLVLAAAALPFASAFAAPASNRTAQAQAALDQLEASFKGRIGLCAIDTASGAVLGHRADERLPFCSTFKVMLAAAILHNSGPEGALLQHQLHYTKSDLVSYSPVTERHLAQGMTVAEACAAALQYSDNTAANLLLGVLGGPQAVTAFARSIGDSVFRLDRIETDLNSAIPGDPRDTTSAAAMARSLQQLLLADTLPAPRRTQLVDWMLGNTTGAARVRAGLPGGWKVTDKTGSGDYGTGNDVAVAWPPGAAPLIVSIYTTKAGKDEKYSGEVVAAATRIVHTWWNASAV